MKLRTIIFLVLCVSLLASLPLFALVGRPSSSTPPDTLHVAVSEDSSDSPADVASLSCATELTGGTMLLANCNQRLKIDTLVWGITAEGRIGYAALSGTLDDGSSYHYENLDAFVRLVQDVDELIGFLWAIRGKESLIELSDLRIGIDSEGRIVVLHMHGRDVATGAYVGTGAIEGGDSPPPPPCCMHQLCVIECVGNCEVTCWGGGGTSCACTEPGGVCVGQTGQACCGVCKTANDACDPGTCGLWTNGGQSFCDCRVTAPHPGE